MSEKKIKVLLVGIAGYGEQYVAALLDPAADPTFEIAGAVDLYPERCKRLEELKKRGVRLYADMDEFYKNSAADLAIISTPIHLHRPFTLKALAQGSHVLCEKPVSATIQDALAMEEARKKADRFVAIGYQWSFCDPIQALKKDILAGDLGRPIRLKTILSWPRPASYYGRSGWAGALKAKDGAWILDSPANNATAHYLHNMFYVIGASRETSAQPAEIRAELYRANRVENYDTAMLRCRTTSGAEILFYTSHAVPSRIGPVLRYEFEKATVYYDTSVVGGGAGNNNVLVARFHDGYMRVYGDPDGSRWNKLWHAARAVRTGEPVACGVEAAIPHILCVNGAQDSMKDIVDFPAPYIKVDKKPDDDSQTWVEGLQSVLLQCYDQGILPSEHEHIPWAKEGRKIDLRGYKTFPSM